MKTFARRVVALALLLMGPVHSQARYETDTGSRLPVPAPARVPDDIKLTDADRARVTMAAFARCTVVRDGRKVEAVLRMPMNVAYYNAMRKLVISDCLEDSQLSFQAVLLRGALFAELWQLRMSAERAGRPAPFTLPPFDAKTETSADYVEGQQVAMLLWIADCVIARDQADASDLVAQAPASKQQRDAYARLAPQIGPCVPQGSTIRISKPMLEGALAEALYRRPTPIQTAAKVP